MSSKNVGYKGRDPVSHRRYNRQVSLARFKRTGKFAYRGVGKMRGSGHRAGEEWGAKKQINPLSLTTRYSKNSPSFDEGVWKYKQSARQKALEKLK